MKTTAVKEVGITIGQSLVIVVVTVFAVLLTVAVAGINTPELHPDAKQAACANQFGDISEMFCVKR